VTKVCDKWHNAVLNEWIMKNKTKK
jgi:hypothetical protein